MKDDSVDAPPWLRHLQSGERLSQSLLDRKPERPEDSASDGKLQVDPAFAIGSPASNGPAAIGSAGGLPPEKTAPTAAAALRNGPRGTAARRASRACKQPLL